MRIWTSYWQYNHWDLFSNKNWKFTTEKEFWLEDKLYVLAKYNNESLGYIKFLIVIISFWRYVFFGIYFKHENYFFFNKVPVTI